MNNGGRNFLLSGDLCTCLKISAAASTRVCLAKKQGPTQEQREFRKIPIPPAYCVATLTKTKKVTQIAERARIAIHIYNLFTGYSESRLIAGENCAWIHFLCDTFLSENTNCVHVYSSLWWLLVGHHDGGHRRVPAWYAFCTIILRNSFNLVWRAPLLSADLFVRMHDLIAKFRFGWLHMVCRQYMHYVGNGRRGPD